MSTVQISRRCRTPAKFVPISCSHGQIPSGRGLRRVDSEWPIVVPALVAKRWGLRRASPQALGPAHGLPVVFVFPRAKHANLVELAVLCAPGPGKFVRAMGKGQYFHNLLLHIGRFREGFSGTQHHRMGRRNWIDYLRLVKTLTSDRIILKVGLDPFGVCADLESLDH